MKPVAVVTESENDLLEMLKQMDIPLVMIHPDDLDNHDLDRYESIAILGGVNEIPICLHPRPRLAIEKQIAAGKRVFCEYFADIDLVYTSSVGYETTESRLVFYGGENEVNGIQRGDILDDQSNQHVISSATESDKIIPLLAYHSHLMVHDHTNLPQDALPGLSDRALWFERENLLLCTFRLSNFHRARFAPRKRWQNLIAYILEWLCGKPLKLPELKPIYTPEIYKQNESLEEQVQTCIDRAVNWFHHANMLFFRNGRYDGVREGINSKIYPDGRQPVNDTIRADCTGETGLAFFMVHLLKNDQQNLKISNDLISVCFDLFQIKEESHLNGLIRHCANGWQINYQDDNSRGVLIPQLLKNLYSGRSDYLPEIIANLNFHLQATGTNGIRTPRLTVQQLHDQAYIRKLASEECEVRSAHFNASYSGALLLAYKQTGIELFKQTGIRGLETLMEQYPNTYREHSETQEYCRLVSPLAWLYWVTRQDRHRQWLYRVVEDLQLYKNPLGGYNEWDSGYQAFRSKMASEECSLLTENGDPVTDLLYSLNWLPTGLIQAYFVTGDPYFKKQWEDIARFMISTQIHSSNQLIDGAWSRAFDVKHMEIFGLPYDLGWAHWVIESGWTVAEISAGLSMGLLADQLIQVYR